MARIDGQERSVRARRGVILCAGGFVMNRAMLATHAPRLLASGNIPIGNPGDTGAGIRMGQGVGAALLHMSEGFITLPFYPPASLTYGIFVNAQAQRFINEDVYHARLAHHALRQLGRGIYLITSHTDYERPAFLNAPVAGTGETIEELAAEIHLDPAMLRHTVDYYNAHAARGPQDSARERHEHVVPACHRRQRAALPRHAQVRARLSHARSRNSSWNVWGPSRSIRPSPTRGCKRCSRPAGGN